MEMEMVSSLEWERRELMMDKNMTGYGLQQCTKLLRFVIIHLRFISPESYFLISGVEPVRSSRMSSDEITAHRISGNICKKQEKKYQNVLSAFVPTALVPKMKSVQTHHLL